MSLRTLESLKQIFNLWELATWKGTVLALWVCLGSRASEQIIYLIDVSFSISITVSPEVLLTRDQADYLWRAQATTVYFRIFEHSVQFSSVAQSCPTLCDPMNRSTPGLPVHHHLPEFTQTRVHQVCDAIQPSHPLSSPSPPAPNPSQHQSLFQWVSSSHEVAKVLEFQLQHHSFQRTPRTDLLQNGLVGSPCSPRDSKEPSPIPQFKSIISSVLSFLHGPTLTSIHNHRKNHSLD